MPGANATVYEAVARETITTHTATFAEFLCAQGLAPLWDEYLERHGAELPIPDVFRETLHRNRLQALGHYLIQKNRLTLARQILNEAGIGHVVTKGAHTREVYYDSPALRPATDIDILVRPSDSLHVIHSFRAAGFHFQGSSANITHECSLVRGSTDIDLHWDILRPGRTRVPMANALLERRVDYGGHWGTDHAGTLFLMLVHPVFCKYSTTPHATLVRLVDLARLLDAHPEAATGSQSMLQKAGLTTAGWITARWLYLLTGSSSAEALARKLQPGPLHRRWLEHWLTTDASTRLLPRPWLIQLGLTLPAHDHWRDALHAAREARRCRKEGRKILQTLEAQLA